MSYRMLCLFCLLVAQGIMCASSEGQIVRRLRDRRAAMSAPQSAPGATVAPGYGPLPQLRGLVARRLQQRRDIVPQQEVQPTPTPAAGQTQQASQGIAGKQSTSPLKQTSASQELTLAALTPEVISAYDVTQLKNALSNANGVLANDLSRFSSSESWQGFLAIPTGVVETELLDELALQTIADRYRRVAADPKYKQIAALASFEQTQTLLSELVNKSSGPLLGPPSGSDLLAQETAVAEKANSPEALPTPTVSAKPLQNSGERSILVHSR